MNAAHRPLPAELWANRFRLTRVLGRGGQSVVYQATDLESQTTVALKALEGPSARGLHWLKNEFRRLADLHHGNLVELGELHLDGESPFFTMELVSGCDFLKYVRPDDDEDCLERLIHGESEEGTGSARRTWLPPQQRTRARFDEARLRESLRQLVQGVAAVHAAGLVHRDLKPSNVLVEEGGRVVILDFGLVVPESSTNATLNLYGTPLFMAPEQAVGKAVGEAADWYAVGVMLFCALTGRLPFEGPLLQVLLAKANEDAAYPGEVICDCPSDLDTLCARLLHRDPAQRPRGIELVKRLVGSEESSQLFTVRPVSALVGRTEQLGALDRALAQTDRQGARAVVLEGPPGVGKTSVAAHFLATRLTRPDDLILSGRCYEQEFVPFKGIDPIVDSLAQHLSRLRTAELSELLPPHLRALTNVFPALHRVRAVANLTPPPSALAADPESRELAFASLAALLGALAARRRLLLFIDDLQWAGSDTMALLEHLCAPRPGGSFLILATRRTSEGWSFDWSASPAINDVLPSWLERIALPPLSSSDASSLVRQLWLESGTRRPARDAELVAAEAGGHPLFLQELARHAARSGEVRAERVELKRVLGERILGLSSPARALLEVSAVAGTPLPVRVLARVAGISRSDAPAIVKALRAAQLVRTDGERRTVEPYHDRVREALLQGVAEGTYALSSGGSLASLHLALAAHLDAARKAGEVEVAPSVVATHFNLGAAAITTPEERLRAAELCAEALTRVQLATAYDAAAHHLATARTHLSHVQPERARAQARALDFQEMQLCHVLADIARVEALFEQLVAQSRGEAELADAFEAKIMLDSARADYARAILTARMAAARLGSTLPESPSKMRLLVIVARLVWEMRGRTPSALAQRPAAMQAKSRAQLRVLMAAMVAAFSADPVLFAWMAARMALISLREGYTELSAYGFSACAVMFAGALRSYRRAHDLSELAEALMQRFPHPLLAPSLAFARNAYTSPYVRPFEESLAGLRLAQQLGLQFDHGLSNRARILGGLSAGVIGFCAGHRLAELDDTCMRAIRVSEQFGYADYGAVVRWLWRAARCLQGLTPNPLEMAEETTTESLLLEEDVRRGWRISELHHALFRCVLRYQLGDFEDAQQAGKEARPLMEAQGGQPTLIILHMYSALAECARLSACRGMEWLRVRRRIRADLAQLARWAKGCPQNFAARHALVRGELARVSGRRDLALRWLERALAEAQQSGCLDVECLAWERLADWQSVHGTRVERERCLRGAIDASTRWGALAKVAYLERKLES